MSEKWQIYRVSTPERIFDKIQNEMAQPVGVFVFGADCDFKNEIANELTAKLEATVGGVPTTRQIVDSVYSQKSVAVAVFDAEASAFCELRHDCVSAMRRAGFKTIVGVYVKCAKLKPLPARGFMKKSCRAEINRQIDALERTPPTSDEVDYLIVV